MEYFHWQRNLAGYSPWVANSLTWLKHVRTQCIILASPDIFTTNNFGEAWLFREEDPSGDVKAQSSPFCKIKDEKKILLQVLCWKLASFFFFLQWHKSGTSLFFCWTLSSMRDTLNCGCHLGTTRSLYSRRQKMTRSWFCIFIGCPASRLAVIGENECL